MISEQGFLIDLKSNSNEFYFIGSLVQSAFRGYLIHKFSSRFDPSICRLVNYSSKSIRIWTLTFEAIITNIQGKIYQFLFLWNPLIVSILLIGDFIYLDII